MCDLPTCLPKRPNRLNALEIPSCIRIPNPSPLHHPLLFTRRRTNRRRIHFLSPSTIRIIRVLRLLQLNPLLLATIIPLIQRLRLVVIPRISIGWIISRVSIGRVVAGVLYGFRVRWCGLSSGFLLRVVVYVAVGGHPACAVDWGVALALAAAGVDASVVVCVSYGNIVGDVQDSRGDERAEEEDQERDGDDATE